MGAILPESKENEILKLLRKDDAKNLQEFIQLNELSKDILYTKHKRTLLQLSCYFESPKCLSKLIELNYNYNKIENYTGCTPLFICAKFNNLEMVRILLAREDCKKLVKNFENLNEFDIAFLKGNYDICYYFLYVYDNDDYNDKNNIINEKINFKKKKENEINTNEKPGTEKESRNNAYDINQIYQKYFYNTDFEYDYFLNLQAENKYPLFNMPLFFRCLCNKTLPSKCPSFAPEHKKTLDLTTKVPDPNETWGHFFKRVVSMELYNPPLVDKKKVSEMNSIYMNTQMKLMENEYGIKMGYYKKQKDDEDEIENDITKHPLDQEDDEVIKISKKGKNILNLNINAKKSEEKKEQNGKEDNIEIKNIDDNDIYENNEENENNIINNRNNEDEDKNGNECIVKVNNNSSERDLNGEKENNDN